MRMLRGQIRRPPSGRARNRSRRQSSAQHSTRPVDSSPRGTAFRPSRPGSRSATASPLRSTGRCRFPPASAPSAAAGSRSQPSCETATTCSPRRTEHPARAARALPGDAGGTRRRRSMGRAAQTRRLSATPAILQTARTGDFRSDGKGRCCVEISLWRRSQSHTLRSPPMSRIVLAAAMIASVLAFASTSVCSIEPVCSEPARP